MPPALGMRSFILPTSTSRPRLAFRIHMLPRLLWSLITGVGSFSRGGGVSGLSVLDVGGDHLRDAQSTARRHGLGKALFGHFHHQRTGLVVLLIVAPQPSA